MKLLNLILSILFIFILQGCLSSKMIDLNNTVSGSLLFRNKDFSLDCFGLCNRDYERCRSLATEFHLNSNSTADMPLNDLGIDRYFNCLTGRSLCRDKCMMVDDEIYLNDELNVKDLNFIVLDLKVLAGEVSDFHIVNIPAFNILFIKFEIDEISECNEGVLSSTKYDNIEWHFDLPNEDGRHTIFAKRRVKS